MYLGQFKYDQILRREWVIVHNKRIKVKDEYYYQNTQEPYAQSNIKSANFNVSLCSVVVFF